MTKPELVRKPRERKTDEERLQELLDAESAHLARAEKAKARRLAFLAELKQRRDALDATMRKATESE